MDNTLQLGVNPGCVLEISEAYYVNINSIKTDKSFISCVDELLKDRNQVNISLSGGLDSQFSLLLCKELKKDINLYTYRSFWKDTIINAEDVYIAQLIADKNNLKLNIEDINLHEFYDRNTHFKYSKNFFNDSPQLAVHLYWIDLLHKKYNINNIMLGGDPPLFKYSKEYSKGKKMRVSNESFFQDILAPYYFLCKKLDIECFRDIFYHSPELVYNSYSNNIDVVNANKKHIDSKPKRNTDYGFAPYKIDTYEFKYLWYKQIIDELVPQKSETNGFENLKKILACESGLYDQYDILYRKPLIEHATNTVKYYMTTKRERNRSIVRNRNVFYDTPIKDLYTDFQKTVEDTHSKSINKYRFDF